MNLKKYKSKRNFQSTSEPYLSKKSSDNALHFCVQKHAARQLHYDFRLEFHGILLSWAVPKGPSLDPKDKRLAIKVEDHPLDYQYFEGVIPKGNYGAGTVEIWDKGYYSVPNTQSRNESEKKIEEGLRLGHLDITLQGTKLQGEFVLQQLKKNTDDKAWLLIKKNDTYASSQEKITTEAPSKVKPQKKIPLAGTKAKMPDSLTPMLCTLVKEPFDDENWIFEIKWDGYRSIAFIDKGKVKLMSRNKLVWNHNFPTIVQDIQRLEGQLILDGELVVLDKKGKSQFHLMQNYQKTGEGPLYYYVFDILYKDGQDLCNVPLIERKEILKKILAAQDFSNIRYSDHIAQKGKAFYKEAAKNKLEGIIGKKITSHYHFKRSREWVKIKTSNQQEVVIGGFTAPRGSRKKFGALLVGVYNEQKELIYSGHVGGGFDSTLLEDVYEKLQSLKQQKSPFKNIPKPNAPVTWVKPQLICEVIFTEWTQDNIMRHPIFQGLRQDKSPQSVKKESFQKDSDAKQSKNSKSKEKQPKNTQEGLTHLDKIYWPKEGYTKGDLIDYYQKLGPFILPYLKDRPLMLHRYPHGVEGNNFYQKDIGAYHPDWVNTVIVKHEEKNIEYIVVNDLQSLLYVVNLGSIDLHPFLSSSNNVESPDFCVIDLDPHDIDFKHVIDTTIELHKILDDCSIKHYCKTSGGKGLHVCIPLQAKYSFEQSRQFAEIIGECIHNRFSTITSLEREPSKRPKKIYIDCLQNRFGQTLVCPYSVRPRPGATVSTPLEWKEVNETLDLTQFTIKTVPQRVKKMGDIFKPILGRGINMKNSLKNLQKLL